MSNDLTFWLVRLGLLGIIVVDLMILARAFASSTTSEASIWFAAFFLVIIMSLPLGLRYVYLRSKRWESNAKTREQIETEVLARLAQEKNANKNTRFSK